MTVERIRIIHPDGRISVRDYAFSQVCEMTSVLTREDRRRFDNKESVITPTDSHFAKAGSDLKLVGEV